MKPSDSADEIELRARVVRAIRTGTNDVETLRSVLMAGRAGEARANDDEAAEAVLAGLVRDGIIKRNVVTVQRARYELRMDE